MSTYGTGTLGAPVTYGGGAVPSGPLLREYGDLRYGDGYYGLGRIPTEGVALFGIEVEIAGVWQDVTCDVRSIATQRGRSRQLDMFTAGTASVQLQDFNDYYNAWNPSGLWAGNGRFRTDVPMRIWAIYLPDDKTCYLWTGTTDEVQDSWPGTTDALTRIDGTDAFKALARQRLPLATAVGANELGGARVARILDAAGYAGARALDVGQQHFTATDYDAIALDMLDEVREMEAGAVFVAGDGTLTFYDRTARDTNTRMRTVQWSFVDRDEDVGSSLTATCYSDLVLTANDDQLYNYATIVREGGSASSASDTASISWYGQRTYTRKDAPLANDTDALTLAQLVVVEHADNERRIDALTFYPLHQDNGTNVATGLRLLDRIRVLRHSPGGTVVDAQLLVQGISHDIVGGGADRQAGSWRVTIQTTDVDSLGAAGMWDVDTWDVGLWSA